MLLLDFKLSVVGMPLDRPLFIHDGPDQIAPVVLADVNSDKVFLKITPQTNSGMVLADLLALSDSLEIVGLDRTDNPVRIYGYQVQAERLVLG
ncbi:hypothetical protein D3P96_05910 [Weissella viridescens]|uniref:Uncharacterized protein n=1 Tax=Weissella viridescens TaxID=1629 RepID=A0A3P2RA41_WEIVI|nr:hypothetical protein [Weissella viridescens]RRG17689.1 hypothetical protein D3P96_05910 [Weissella viridescens]